MVFDIIRCGTYYYVYLLTISGFGHHIIEGDIVLDRNTKLSIKEAKEGDSDVGKREAITGGHWPDKTIPYEFSGTLSK